MIEQVQFLPFIECIVLIFILISLIILNFKKFNNHGFTSDEYIALIHSLNQIIDDYKTVIFEPRIKTLYQSYDLNPESQTRANDKFKEQYNEYIRFCCRDILKNYISKEQKRISDKFFTGDGLSLYVFSKLEGNNQNAI